MKFMTYGGFEIAKDDCRHVSFDESFWEQVATEDEGLPYACGCYVFAIKHGKNTLPWYVGKAERIPFKKECVQPTKLNYYNQVLPRHTGTPLLFLIPRLTGSEKKFSKPTRTNYRDVDFLETLLIGYALKRNPELMNVKKTALLRDMKVPGIVNNPQARPSKAVVELRNALGLQD